jgi:hypothetical protein
MLEGFTAWLEQSDAAAFLSDPEQLGTWLIIPVSQCIHLVSVSVVMLSSSVLNLRMLGFGATRLSLARLSAELMPWLWIALAVLFVTGVVQTIAEPGRELLNIGFRTKMVLLAAAVMITAAYDRTIRMDPNYWEMSQDRRSLAKILAVASLFLWIGVAVAGRLIAYLDIRHPFLAG